MKNVLILGHKGMLGHMVSKLLIYKGVEVITLNDRWSGVGFKNTIKDFDGEYIINCVGAIHQKTKQFDINWELPQWLDENVNCKIIHPGTDCEMDNDNYGLSKKKASDFILKHGQNTKILKASIIGPELNSNFSLLEWFLSQEK